MTSYEVINEFIIENFLFGDGSKFSDDVDLLKTSTIDSTGILELVSFIEEYFNIVVQDNELIQENFSSVNRIKAFLNLKLLVSTK